MSATRVSRIEIPVQTATVLREWRRLEAVGRLVDRLVGPEVHDPLIARLERTSAEAKAAGLSAAEIDGELDAYNSALRA